MKIFNNIPKFGIALTLITAPFLSNAANQLEKEPTQDVYVAKTPSVKGNNDSIFIAKAPSPAIKIQGKMKNAKFVVDLNSNILYKYDKDGNPKTAYLVASGKKSTPTHKGVRIVTHVETYPYNMAPKYSKRRRNPSEYGPKIICVNKHDPKKGTQSSTGEFIHGNNDPESLGKYSSHGCIRMDNEIIQELAKEVKAGDIVILQ